MICRLEERTNSECWQRSYAGQRICNMAKVPAFAGMLGELNSKQRTESNVGPRICPFCFLWASYSCQFLWVFALFCLQFFEFCLVPRCSDFQIWFQFSVSWEHFLVRLWLVPHLLRHSTSEPQCDVFLYSLTGCTSGFSIVWTFYLASLSVWIFMPSLPIIYRVCGQPVILYWLVLIWPQQPLKMESEKRAATRGISCTALLAVGAILFSVGVLVRVEMVNMKLCELGEKLDRELKADSVGPPAASSEDSSSDRGT